jgi:hypothetical protein
MGHVVQIFSMHNAWNKESARKGTCVPLAKKCAMMLTSTQIPTSSTHIFVDPKTQRVVDNQWIIMYNLHLATMSHTHINVEICSSISIIKYVYKYVCKGPDRATAIVKRREDTPGKDNNTQAVVTNGEWQNRDEIKAYLERRYVFASETSWRLFSFRMHDKTPFVTHLAVHEPGMHTVVYNDNASIFETVNNKQNQKTTLTE